MYTLCLLSEKLLSLKHLFIQDCTPLPVAVTVILPCPTLMASLQTQSTAQKEEVNWVSLLTSQLTLLRAQLSALTTKVEQVEKSRPEPAELQKIIRLLEARLESMEAEIQQNRAVRANMYPVPIPTHINLESLDD